MKLLLIVALLVLVPVIAVALWAMGAYNRLVSLRNRFQNAVRSDRRPTQTPI